MELFRKMRPGDINLCVGVSDQPGTLTYIEFDDPALNTFDAELAAERERATPYRVVNRIGVPVARLRDLLEQHLPPGRHIDFMSIDVEGYDLEVVQSNDWEKYRPTYLLVECLESRLSSINEAPIHRFLVEQGYTLYAKTVNTLFYKDGSAP
jgi:FkbM family methyltransferase